jgi:hypothetical protein
VIDPSFDVAQATQELQNLGYGIKVRAPDLNDHCWTAIERTLTTAVASIDCLTRDQLLLLLQNAYETWKTGTPH